MTKSIKPGNDELEAIDWPQNFKPLEKLLGTMSHGDVWKIQDVSTQELEDLELRSTKIQAAIKIVRRELDDIETERLRKEEIEEDLDYHSTFTRIDSTDDQIEPHIGSSDISKNLNIDAVLAKKENLLNNLETEYNRVVSNIENLKKFMLQHEDQELKVLVSLQALESMTSIKPIDLYHKKPSKSDEDLSTQAEYLTSLYAAKLVSPANVSIGDSGGRRFVSSATNRERSETLVDSLLQEGNKLINIQSKVLKKFSEILNQKTQTNQKNVIPHSVNLCPLIAVRKIDRSVTTSPFLAAFISPLCTNRSIADIIPKIAGKRREYWFKDDLLFENLKNTILMMAILQHYDIFHGNIKPTNLYVSDDGLNLLIGDFLPESEIFRWYENIARSLSRPPEYSSPELTSCIVEKKISSRSKIKSIVDLHKNDVFCLGLMYLYIATRIDIRNLYRNKKKLQGLLKRLTQEQHSKELVDLITLMVEFDASSRLTFWDMLTFSEKAFISGQTLISSVANIFGY